MHRDLAGNMSRGFIFSGAGHRERNAAFRPDCQVLRSRTTSWLLKAPASSWAIFFELEDLGARNLKGIAGSVCVNEQLERLVAGPW